jgi:transketolase C-terminal domain/subunit
METQIEIPIKRITYTRDIPEKYAKVLSELTWRCYEKRKVNERVFEDLVVDLKFKYRDVGFVVTYSDITVETDEEPVHLVRVVDLSGVMNNLGVLRARETVTIPIASAVYYGCDRDYEYLFNVDVDTRWLRSVYDRKEIEFGIGSQRILREFMDDVADLLHEYIPAVP